jgi:hypothetical protein
VVRGARGYLAADRGCGAASIGDAVRP